MLLCVEDMRPLPVISIIVIVLILSGAGYAIHSRFLYDSVPSEEVFKNPPIQGSSPGAVRIPIIIYHRVRPDFPSESEAQRSFSITPQLFEQQLRYLQDQGYTAISLDEFVRDAELGTTSPAAKPVVLTFDDGWQNQYSYALPLLEKYHMTAVFYIYTDPIGKYPEFLTWDEIKTMDAAGMTIGSHTLSHPHLSSLSPAQLRNELFESKKVLEDHLGKSVVHFASPYGYTSDALVALLKEAGYQTGRTTYKGAYHSRDDLLHLTGFPVRRDFKDFTWLLQYSQ